MSGPLRLKEIEEAMRSGQLTAEEALAILAQRQEAGAQRLIKRAKKELETIEAYHARSSYFLEAKRKGYHVIAGLDEVGRGPLAGPVTVAAVVLDPDQPIYGLRDSKRLSAKRREALAEEIREKAFAFSIASFTERQIDQLNILEATKQAMLLAVETLEIAPHFLLLDALELDTPIPQLAVIGGGDKCNEIAAASILAKVERDRYMQSMHKRYPAYRFDKNKGYGTAEHLKALREHGPCPIHRRTFLGHLIKET